MPLKPQQWPVTENSVFGVAHFTALMQLKIHPTKYTSPEGIHFLDYNQNCKQWKN